MKEHLKTKWKQIHADYKNSKDGESKSSKSGAAASSSSQKKPISLPYIPGGLLSYTTGDSVRDMMIEKFIGKMQTPVKPEDPQLSKEKLLKAIEVSKGIELAIFDLNNSIKQEKARKDKFRSMMAVLGTHAHMKTKLLDEDDDLTPLQFVQMKRDDFLSEELKRQQREAEMNRMQSQRTDWARA